MLAQLRRSLLLTGFALLAAGCVWAQTTTIEGDVKGANGEGVKGAVIHLTRTDIKGNYEVKSDKKGHWIYTGLPMGKFDITCSINGQVVDKVNGVQSKYGDPTEVNFDAAKAAQQQAAAQQANASGELSQDQARGMSKEQKEQYEAQLKKNSEAIKKNKALNDTFNAGQDALKAAQADTDQAKKATDYQTAVDAFNKGAEMDAGQAAIWNSLGEAYTGLAKTQTGDAQTKSYDQAVDAYKKSLALPPPKGQENDDAKRQAAIYNQIGNIYGAEKKMPEATDALNKAAQLDPAMAAKANFNMGANLVNGGHPDQAAEFFKKAADADPNYAEAWFQYGSLLMMKGAVDPKTGQQTYPPDTATALKKYLELDPNGKHAQEATSMLQAMGEKVQTNVTVKKP
ncbi:MAG: carboxypeptidase regulatory-like domain-containing protein, partial [Acidobacteriaceae bacterium]|nr:carboxypeptidase regulatory-like domain-containing protein [Acidobacteriaceae bacterium]